jgi:hypothetical protein
VFGAAAYQDAVTSANGITQTVSSNLDVTTGLYRNEIQNVYAKTRATFGEGYTRFQKSVNVTDLATAGYDYTTGFTVGFNYSKTVTPNGDGTYQQGLAVQQGVAMVSDKILVGNTRDSYLYHTLYRNQTAKPTLVAPTQTNYSVQLSGFGVNDFQLYDFTEVEEQPHAPSNLGADVVTWVEDLGTSKTEDVTYESGEVHERGYVSAIRYRHWYKLHAMKYFPTAVTASAWVSGQFEAGLQEAAGMWLGRYAYSYLTDTGVIPLAAPVFLENGGKSVPPKA